MSVARKLRLPLSAPLDSTRLALPPVLQSPLSRGADGTAVNLVPGLTVAATYELAAAPTSEEKALDTQLLALEAEDGTTLFIRADRLLEDIARLCPGALDEDGGIDFARFRERDSASRGAVSSWIWKRLSLLTLDQDAIIDQARKQAKEWLGDKVANQLGDQMVLSASWLGAKALMAAIESQLAGTPGLYQWRGGGLEAGDLCREGDARFKDWDREPGLLFIHGTGSHTVGGFGDLRGGESWPALQREFGERIFGFEHRTFSESPIDNALALARVLPGNARIRLVTHSRGGLVGDLLCLGSFTAESRRLIDEYRRAPRPDEVAKERDKPELATLREQVAQEERRKLGELVDLLAKKSLRIERYARVASPAAGTALLSDNLDLFMSGLLALVRKLGSWSVGTAVGALATPVAGKLAKDVADRMLGMLSRVVLEIADKRLQPQLVPGIEAMLPDAPLGMFLARAPRLNGVKMAVIAGDIEDGGLFQRLGVLFTDWMLFDRADNDLVVDTASMYQGLASGNGAHALFDQGPAVNHFSYFRNPRTRNALRDWLLSEEPEKLTDWSVLPTPQRQTREAVARGAAEAPKDNTRPVLIFLPGIMGSHLEIHRKKANEPGSGDRIWLDALDLPRGGLQKIAWGTTDVEAEALLDLAYGALARHLEASHRVIPFPYDWRKQIEDAAGKLQVVVRQALADHPDQPVRLLAHSMGGLVVRTMIANDPELWKQVTDRPGGRLLMLGTPNHGSHLFVETLLGKSNTIRMLGRVDLAHSLQAVMDIVAAFPGALQLLPQPGFADTGGVAATDYYDPVSWKKLAEKNTDFWFGDKLGGKPTQDDLNAAKAFWGLLGDGHGATNPIEAKERIAYVYGQADNTPCGLRETDRGIEMLGTSQGDGSVTWASGRLEWLPEDRCWMMPVDHMGLTSTSGHFEAIADLLAEGTTRRLGRLSTARGSGAAPVRPYQPGPMPGYPGEQELVTRLVGGHSRVPRPRARHQSLEVGVRAMDLRFTRLPLMCGHYQGDPISGPEAAIDDFLVNRALTRRQNLGVHAGEVGTASVVLMPRSREDILRGTGRGAVVVGLGEMGNLTSREISETVRAGVLRLLLHADDRTREEFETSSAMEDDTPDDQGSLKLKLASLLIGYNSTNNISLDESVRAITLGVLEANSQFALGDGAAQARGRREPAQVTRLEFVEMYRDAAITAAHAVRDLSTGLARELKRLDMCVVPDAELNLGIGMRPRLSLLPSASYWPRLVVSNADDQTARCAAECYDLRSINPIPPDAMRKLLAMQGCKGEEPASPPTGLVPPTPIQYASRIKFVYLGQRAHAETEIHARQPGLAEILVDDLVRSTRYSPGTGIGNTLFHLLIPLDFKAAAREAKNLVLAVDPATANIPWEMLEMDGEPLIRGTRLIRQLVSPDYRRKARNTRNPAAFLVANPKTRGFHAQFGGPAWQAAVKPNADPEYDRLNPLPGSVAEVAAVKAVLERNRYQITETGVDATAGEVFNKLFAHPYRILVISAHGVHQVQARDGTWRSGAVLSDGLLLSAAEVRLMEAVPELVFLNCCHLGRMSPEESAHAGSQRLAYSLAREFIEMGVRCVVAAGWEVDDEAGRDFAETFFDQMVGHGAAFGQAIHAARLHICDNHPDCNTWGAYQAYGDPDFRLEIRSDQGNGDDPMLAPDELLDWLERRRLVASHGLDRDNLTPAERFQALETRVDKCLRQVPAAWLDRPEIQQAIGMLYGEYGMEGFAKARAALARAIAEEATNGVVAIASIEQLANLEAGQAGTLSKDARRRTEALDLASKAVERLQQLINIAECDFSTDRRPNTERQSLLGDALKCQAALMCDGGDGWDDIKGVLLAARVAYKAGEQNPGAPDFNPHATINRMQLDAVLGQPEPDQDKLIALCREAASRRYNENFEFLDGVMTADADLVALLGPGTRGDALRDMAKGYRDAVKQLSRDARKFDTVAPRFCLLARVVQARGGEEDDALARSLAELARQLDPDAAPCGLKTRLPATPAPPSTPADTPPPASKVRGGKRKGGKT